MWRTIWSRGSPQARRARRIAPWPRACLRRRAAMAERYPAPAGSPRLVVGPASNIRFSDASTLSADGDRSVTPAVTAAARDNCDSGVGLYSHYQVVARVSSGHISCRRAQEGRADEPRTDGSSRREVEQRDARACAGASSTLRWPPVVTTDRALSAKSPARCWPVLPGPRRRRLEPRCGCQSAPGGRSKHAPLARVGGAQVRPLRRTRRVAPDPILPPATAARPRRRRARRRSAGRRARDDRSRAAAG